MLHVPRVAKSDILHKRDGGSLRQKGVGMQLPVRSRVSGPYRWRDQALRYGIAVLLTGITFGLMRVLPSIFGEAPFLLLWGAAVLAAAFGGFWPGVLAIGLALIGLIYLQPGPFSGGLTLPAVVKLL